MTEIKSCFKFLLRHWGKIIFIIIIAAGCCAYYFYREKKAAAARAPEMTETITRGDLKLEINKDGAFQAKTSVEVNSRANGRIKEIYVKEGDIVKEGQKLLVVQPGQSIYEKYQPVDVYAPAGGLVLRCLNDRWTRQSGMVYDLPQPGDSISGTSGGGSATCLMKIIKPGKYVVPIKIGEYDITKIKPGMPVKISVPAKPDVSYEGVISLISPQPEIKDNDYWNPDSNKVEFITVAETKGNIKEILLGLSASVQISLESKQDALIVPNAAVFEERDGKTGRLDFYVYKKTGDKKAKKIKTELGLRNDSQAELLNSAAAGLAEGDTLLLDLDAKDLKIEDDAPAAQTVPAAQSVQTASAAPATAL
jgi:multidrug efflux pump subunit AcrA (membrane-fusion protein)